MKKLVLLVSILAISTICEAREVRMEAEMMGNEPGTNNNPYLLYEAFGKILGKARPTMMNSSHAPGTSLNPLIIEPINMEDHNVRSYR